MPDVHGCSPLAREVIAFEPVPHSFNTLRQVTVLAHLANVRTCRFAISDVNGRARFSVPVNQGFYGGYYMAALHDEGEMEVETHTIDALIADGVPEPDFIKCDVEGAETKVIQGARRLLSRRRPIWLLETFEPAVLRLMESLGYATYVRTPENSLAAAKELRGDYRNYVFLPVDGD